MLGPGRGSASTAQCQHPLQFVTRLWSSCLVCFGFSFCSCLLFFFFFLFFICLCKFGSWRGMWGIKCCFSRGHDRESQKSLGWKGPQSSSSESRLALAFCAVFVFIQPAPELNSASWGRVTKPDDLGIYSPAAQGDRQKAAFREKEIVLEIMTCLAGFNKFSNGIRCPWLKIVTSS